MLTLSMIVKNEEKYIRDCLKSVSGIADEIVIVDTGSTDKTLDFAREFNCKIFNYEWSNDFSAARNFALSKSTGDWILYLDADERLEENSKNKINEITSVNSKTGVKCIVTSVDDKKDQPQIMKYVRLFARTEGIGFSGCVHEQIEESLLKNGYTIIDSNIEIIHIGYNVPEDEIKLKANRNLELLKKEYAKNKSSYYAYQLANTYSILGDKAKAAEYYINAVKDNLLLKEYKAYSYMNLADYELSAGRIDEAEKYIIKGKTESREDVLVNLVASQIYLRKNKNTQALNCCKIAYEQNENIRRQKNYSKVMNISVRFEKIIYHAMYISLISGELMVFKYFIKELVKNAKERPGTNLFKEASFVTALVQQKKLSAAEIKNYIEAINDDNLILILTLLKSYENKPGAELILEGIKEQYIQNSKFLSTYGLILYELKKYSNAEEIFKKGIDVKEKDPATFFYLISLYVHQQKYDELSGIVEMAEREFKDILELKERIIQLKEKLSTLNKVKS